jgi:hypothetical protein
MHVGCTNGFHGSHFFLDFFFVFPSLVLEPYIFFLVFSLHVSLYFPMSYGWLSHITKYPSGNAILSHKTVMKTPYCHNSDEMACNLKSCIFPKKYINIQCHVVVVELARKSICPSLC